MRVKSRIIGITGAALLLGTVSGWCQQAQTDTQAQRGQLAEKDYRFLENAIRGGMQEVQTGELAKQKGVDQTVRNFGDRMVTDHGKANDELKQLAASKQATLPATLSHGQQATVDDRQQATGAACDKTFAKEMVKDHRHDVKE